MSKKVFLYCNINVSWNEKGLFQTLVLQNQTNIE